MDNSARVSSVQFIPYGAQRSLASSSVAAFPTDITAAKAKKAFAHVDSVLKRLADEEEAILGKRPIIPSAPSKAKDFSLPSIPIASRRSVTVPTRTSAQHNITAELTLPPIPQDVATFTSKQLQSANTEYVRSYSVSHPTQPPVPPAAPPATAAAKVANSIERDFRQKAAERRRIAAEAQRLKHAETCPRCARRSQIGEQFLEIKEKVRVAREAGGVRPPTTPRSRPASGPSCILGSRKGNSFDKSSGPDAGDIANDENIQTIDVRRRRNLPGSDDNYHNCRHHSTDRGYRRSRHHVGSSSDNESCCHGHHGHRSGGQSPHDMPQSSASPRRATISESLVSTSPTLNSFYDRFGNRHRLLSPSERAERAEQRRHNLKDNYTCCRRIGCAGYMGETGGVFYIDNDGNRHEHCPHRRSRHTAEEEGQDPDESVSSHASSGVDDHLTSKQDKEDKRWRRISLTAAKRKSVSPLDISDGPHVNVRKYTGTVSGTFGKSKRFSYSGHDVNEPVYYRRRGRNSEYDDNDGSDSDSRDSWDGNTGITAKGRRKGNEGRIPYRRSGEANYDDGRMGNHPSRSRRDHSGGSGRDSRRFGGGWGQSKTTSRSPNRKPPRLTPAQERRQARLHQSQWEKDRLAREARMARKRLAKEREEAEVLAKQRAIEEAERLEKERLLAEWEADQARKHNAEQQDRRHFLQEYQNRIETHKGTRPGLEKKLATLSTQLEAAPADNAEVLRELEERIATRKAQLAAAATASTDARDAANGARRLIFESGDECEALLRHIRAARIDQITSFVGKGTTSLLTLRDLLVPGNDAESLSATNSPTKLPKGEFEDIDSAEVFNRSNSRSDGNIAKRSAHQNRNGSSPTSASASTEKNILNKWKLAATSIADIADEIRSRFSAANNTFVEEHDPHDVSNGANPLSPNSISRTSTFMGRMEESSEVQNVKTRTQKNINVVTSSRDTTTTTTTNVPMHISASRKKCLRLGHEWALAFLEAADLVALRGGKCPMCLHEEEEEEYLLATTQPVAHKKSDDLTTQMFLEAATPNTLTLEGGKRLGIGRMHSKSHSDSHRTVSGHSTLTAAHQSSTSSESESSTNESGKRVNNRDKQPVDSSAMFISINVGDQTAPPISLAAPNATGSHSSHHHHQRAGSLSNSLIGLLGEGQLPPTEVDITTVDHKRAKNKQRRGKEANGGDAPAPAPSREEINRRVAAIVAAATKSNVLTSLAVNESPTKSPKKQTSKQSARKPSRATDGRNDSFLNTSNSGTFADSGNGEANSHMSIAALTADMLAPYRRQVLRALVFEAAKSREEFSRWKEVGEHAVRNLEAKRAVAKAMKRDEIMRHAIGYHVPKSFEESKNKQHQPFELESLNSVTNPTFPVPRTSNNSELLTSSVFNGTQRPQPVVDTSSNSIDGKPKMQLNARSLVEAIRDVNAKLATATRLQQQRTYGGDHLWGDSDEKHATKTLDSDSIFQQREVTVRHVSPMRGPAAAAYERLARLRSIDAGNHLVRSAKPLCPQPPAGGNARPTALRIRELPLVANGGTPINFLRSALDV